MQVILKCHLLSHNHLLFLSGAVSINIGILLRDIFNSLATWHAVSGLSPVIMTTYNISNQDLCVMSIEQTVCWIMDQSWEHITKYMLLDKF